MEKSGEDALIEARRGKAEQLRSRGQNPFANDAAEAERCLLRELRDQFASALVEPISELRYDPAKVEALAGGREYYVLGRLVSRRGFGKASFLRLRDMSDELQLFAKQDVLGEGFEALSEIDIADHLEARGQAMVTKTGELSLQVTSLRLLTKALRPLPDKFHGLTDVDIRYRRRYVDLVANPEVSVALRARSIIVQGLRDFLDSQGFLEVETPTLHPLVGGAAAKPFKTHHNALDLELFLRIAPELYLKRLLVGGLERVYEIGRCYRNEGISTRHNPEFTMLEFYQAYATYETLMEQAERLFRHVDAFLERRLTALGLSAYYEAWLAERPFALSEPFARVPMKLAVSSALARAELPAEISALEAQHDVELQTRTEVRPGQIHGRKRKHGGTEQRSRERLHTAGDPDAERREYEHQIACVLERGAKTDQGQRAHHAESARDVIADGQHDQGGNQASERDGLHEAPQISDAVVRDGVHGGDDHRRCERQQQRCQCDIPADARTHG
jgi:lysyl-tRNA synthetase, class II